MSEKSERVFISGATGVLGRRVLPALTSAGYEVGGLSRSDQNGAWVEGTSPIDPSPGGVFQSAVDLENKVAQAESRGLPTCVLRFGMFYAAEAAQTKSMLQALARGFFPIIGEGDTCWNMIHADDAAKAVLCAIERKDEAIGKPLDIADDEPVQVKVLLRDLAHRMDGPNPRFIPLWLARWLLGSHVVDYLMSSVRCRNQPAKDTLDWRPAHATYREGFDTILERDSVGAN
ncbi:MAG: NAD-dependent epimerase/dehydratase family protein [Anaerolineales bacterium]